MKHPDLDTQKKLARLAAFTELNPRPVIEIDFKGNVLDVNSSASSLFPDLQKKGAKHAYLSDIKKVITLLKKEKKPLRREIKIGATWFKQVFYYIPDFELIHVYGSDVTSRKETQEAMKKSESRYHSLFNKMNYGYALQDIIFDRNKKPVDYRFVDVNPAFEKLSSMKRDWIVGKTVNEIARKPETEESRKTRLQYDKVALGGEPLYLETYNEKAKKYFELYAYQPNRGQIALIFSDITNRKKTDEEKNNFISIMSHELRNPLTPILANAQFIRSVLEQQKLTHPAIIESIETIEKEAKIMAALLNDILDVSRMSRQKIQLKKSRINIAEVIKNSVKSSMPFINTKRQEISVTFGQNPLFAHADPLRIEQIMVNIINNASKYTQPEGTIHVSCKENNGKIEITVKDNGIGMSAGKIKRIFELFSNEGQPFMGIGGLGIGLNIVKNLVDMHQGTILVNSRGNNKGSEFIIRLPLHKSSAPTKSAPEVTPAPLKMATRARKVLVVDDNEDIRRAMCKILNQQGYETQEAANGARAVKVAAIFQPDTALIDIGLPDISGYKVAQLLRAKHTGGGEKMRLIAFSGYGQAKDKALSAQAGFDHHLTKPVDVNQLIVLLG